MTKVTWKPGDYGIFQGYGEQGEGFEPILEPNQPFVVKSIAENGNLNVAAVDGETGERIMRTQKGEDGKDEQVEIEDQLWPTEAIPAELTTAEDGATETAADAAESGQETGQEAAPEAPAAEKTATETKPKAKRNAKAKKASTKSAKKAAKKADTKADTKTEAAPSTETEEPSTTTAPTVPTVAADGDLLAQAKELSDTVEVAYFRLGGVLRQIFEAKTFDTLPGYNELSQRDGFKRYVETEISCGERKAYYLMSIHEFFTRLGFGESELAGIGWAKAKEIARLSKGNFDERVDEIRDVLNNARNQSRDELSQVVTNMINGTNETAVRRTKFVFMLAEEDGENAKRALARAGELTGESDPAKQFEYIVNDWLGMEDDNGMTLEQAIQFVSAKFGVRLEVVEEGGEVAEEAQEETTG